MINKVNNSFKENQSLAVNIFQEQRRLQCILSQFGSFLFSHFLPTKILMAGVVAAKLKLKKQQEAEEAEKVRILTQVNIIL